MHKPEDTHLGKETEYEFQYNPSLLMAIPRADNRRSLGIDGELPFHGVDIWNAYELSWLEPGGKPAVAIATLTIPADSPAIVESKSLKLYLNSFNQSVYASMGEVADTIRADLSQCLATELEVSLSAVDSASEWMEISAEKGRLLDDLDVDIQDYSPNPDLLVLDDRKGAVEETVYSHLLRSNCPVTGQPDWGSVFISYRGRAINHASILKYIVSYRENQEFHEHCVEQIFTDIMRECAPSALTVYARYLRRGGIDINPYRSTSTEVAKNKRLNRQ